MISELKYLRTQTSLKVDVLIELAVEWHCKKMLLLDLRCKLECGVVSVAENVDESILERQVELLAVSQT